MVTACLLLFPLGPAGAAEATAPAPNPPSPEASPTPGEEDEALRALKARVEMLEDQLELIEALEDVAASPPPAALPTFLSALNPRITIFSNAVGRLDTLVVEEEAHGETIRFDNVFYLRETEIDFRASADPFVDGQLTLALEGRPDGHFEFHVEEAIMTIRRLPLPLLDHPPGGLVLQVGKMRAAFGRLNQSHTHDLPQTTRPTVHLNLLGEEGAMGTGLAGSFFLPLDRLDPNSTLQASVQLFGPQLAMSANGTHLIGALTWSRTLGVSHRIEVGGTLHHGFSPRNPDLEDDLTFGAELLYQWRPAGRSLHRGLVIGGQWLQSERPALGLARAQGFYGFAQVQVSRELFLGLRYDQSESHETEGWSRGVFPYLSFYPSEFFRLRVGWQHTFYEAGQPELGTFWFELNLVFGSHPPHPYWVHR